MKTITWSVQPGGHMQQISHKETIRQMRAGFAEIEKVCNLKFIRKTSWSNLRFEFHNNEGMITYHNGIKQYALGLAHSNGRIKFNKQRVINANQPGNRNIIVLTQHESFHVFMRWVQHSTNPRCIIGSGNPTYFCRREVEFLQDKYGPPAQIWYPVDRALVGQKIRDLTKERDQLKAERDASTDKAYRTIKQNANLALMREQITLSAEWWELNNYWRGVPMAHVV